MTIIINETGERKELLAVDNTTGCEWTQDLLGNSGYQRKYDADDNVCMDADDYQWWSDYIAGYDATEREALEMADEVGVDGNKLFRACREYAGQDDMESERPRAMQYLQEWASEHGVTYPR